MAVGPTSRRAMGGKQYKHIQLKAPRSRFASCTLREVGLFAVFKGLNLKASMQKVTPGPAFLASLGLGCEPLAALASCELDLSWANSEACEHETLQPHFRFHACCAQRNLAPIPNCPSTAVPKAYLGSACFTTPAWSPSYLQACFYGPLRNTSSANLQKIQNHLRCFASRSLRQSLQHPDKDKNPAGLDVYM